jgi:hypothetical protein
MSWVECKNRCVASDADESDESTQTASNESNDEDGDDDDNDDGCNNGDDDEDDDDDDDCSSSDDGSFSDHDNSDEADDNEDEEEDEEDDGLSSSLGGISLCIIGESGTGKSSLCSKLAHTIHVHDREHCVERDVIIRFCGSSGDSGDGMKLLRSIIAHICICRDITPTVEQLSEDYSSLVEEFHELLAVYPVVLILDGLDQLSNIYLERSELSFLTGVRPHPDSRIIVSSLPDLRAADGLAWKHLFGCDRVLRDGRVPRYAWRWRRCAGSREAAPSSCAPLLN